MGTHISEKDQRHIDAVHAAKSARRTTPKQDQAAAEKQLEKGTSPDDKRRFREDAAQDARNEADAKKQK